MAVDGPGEIVRVEEGSEADSDDNLRVWALLEDPDNDVFDGVVVRFDDMWTSDWVRPNAEADLDDIAQFDWTRVDEIEGDDGRTYVSEDLGMDVLVLEDDATDTRADLTGTSCSNGENDVVTPSNGSGNGGDTFVSATFSYCAPSEGEPACFPHGRTFCAGFEWWVPTSVGNEIQGDSVAFDLGFYTEQCRHNGEPGSTLGGGSDGGEASAEPQNGGT
jgi:hypothetical protein